MKTQPAATIRNFVFLDGATSPQAGQTLIVTDQAEGSYKTLTVQVVISGTATVKFAGGIYQDPVYEVTAFVDIKALNLATGEMVGETTTSGIFRVDVTGLQEVRVDVSSAVAGANISAIGNLTA